MRDNIKNLNRYLKKEGTNIVLKMGRYCKIKRYNTNLRNPSLKKLNRTSASIKNLVLYLEK